MRRRLIIAATAWLVLLSGCSVPSEDSAHRVDPEDVPYQLAQTTTTTSAGAVDDDADDGEVDVFLVRDERLAVVKRDTSPIDPQSVLALLAQGPDQAEKDAGLRTALVPDLAEIVEIRGNLITIDLDAEFSALAPIEQRLALAQITFAMAQLDVIDRVEFLVAGLPASVPRGDGSSTDRPVTPDDYIDVAPL